MAGTENLGRRLVAVGEGWLRWIEPAEQRVNVVRIDDGLFKRASFTRRMPTGLFTALENVMLPMLGAAGSPSDGMRQRATELDDE